MSRFFQQSKASKIAGLQKKSDGILSIFTQTQEDCKTVNGEIKALIDEHNSEIATLQANVTTLTGVHATNQKLHDKIDQFLNTD